MTSISRRLALTLCGLALAAPAVAKDKKLIDPDKKVCRSEVPTGSRFPVRLCHTAAEWAQIDGTNGSAARTTLDRTANAGLAASLSSSASGR